MELQKVPGEVCRALGEQAVGLFREVFLRGLINPCCSPLRQSISFPMSPMWC